MATLTGQYSPVIFIPPGLNASGPQNEGYRCVQPHLALKWVLEIQTHVFMFVQQMFLSTELPLKFLDFLFLHNQYYIQESNMWGWRDGSAAKSTNFFSRGPGFNSQHPHGNSQLSIIPESNTLT